MSPAVIGRLPNLLQWPTVGTRADRNSCIFSHLTPAYSQSRRL